jgi:hypothetical protein
MTTLKPKQMLDELLPYGVVATRKWLSSQGMSRHAIDNALKSNRLKSLSTGVFSRYDTPLSWQGVVYSLQHMSNDPIYLGGLSALEQLGFGHYLNQSELKTIHLYSETKCPLWLNKLDLNVKFTWHNTKQLWPESMLFSLKEYSRDLSLNHELTSLKISCPEKAYIEMLVDVPKVISFDHANEIIQGMTSLSPKKLESLLMACKSIKVKRLFLWLAERQRYAWFKKLDNQQFELGTGKRVISKSGKLDKKYLITVPEHLYG